jgi:RNA polymerase sigma-70 factor (ECF subfamily)
MRRETQIARDALLAIRCQLGEPRAFRALVDEMEQPLLYYVTKLTGDADVAPDVLQQIWLVAFDRIGKLREPAALRTWLYRIARGTALNRIRSDVTRRRIEKEAAVVANADSMEQPQFDDADVGALHAALDLLDERRREVLVLHFLDDLSIEEIAEVVGVPPGTVKSRIYHAKRELRELLEMSGHETNE